MITIKRLAIEALCIDERDMPKLKQDPGTTYICHHDSFGDMGVTTVVDVVIESTGKHYLADKVTGSLYSPITLRCYTGALELRCPS